MDNRFSVLDGEIYNSNAGLIFADGESVYRVTPTKDDDLTMLKEIIRRANAFEPGGEVERLREALAAVDWQEVMTDMGAACQEFCVGACSCSDRIETVREVAALAAKVGDA